ncbi:hypothetical protein [Anaeromusa acidaminophila]|uniref:hypothetical protein n=1 Tax=Anaeromusa acidaminophila TaxID=81464 RepID=UPI001C02D1F2|nr:hypothetical protein [Anaeromusa acidaminophila]
MVLLARRILTKRGIVFSNVIIRRATKPGNTGVVSPKAHKMGIKTSLIGEFYSKDKKDEI